MSGGVICKDGEKHTARGAVWGARGDEAGDGHLWDQGDSGTLWETFQKAGMVTLELGRRWGMGT